MAEQSAFFIDPRYASKVHKTRDRKAAVKAEGEKRAPGAPKKHRMSSKVFDCSSCGLCDSAKTPKMNPQGKGALGLVIVGETIRTRDDRSGRYMASQEGDLVRSALQEYGISLEEDCVVTSAVQCLSPEDAKPANVAFWSKCCSERLHQQLAALQPKMIITLGLNATKTVLQNTTDIQFSNVNIRGSAFPSQRYQCWVGALWSPEYVLKSQKTFTERRKLFVNDMAAVLERIGLPVPKPLVHADYTALKDLASVLVFFDKITDVEFPVSYDFETTGLSPYAVGAKILCVGFDLSPDGTQRFYLPFEHKEAWSPEELAQIRQRLCKFITSRTPKVIQNYSMEERFGAVLLGVSVVNLYNDTMVSEHVVDERKAVCSLADQVFRAFGVEYKGMVEHSDLANAPELELAPYNTLDAGYTALKSTMQRAHFEKNPDLIGGSQFFLRTLPALVNLEKRGIAVDRARANEIKGSDGKDGKPRSGAMGAVADCEDYFNAHDFIKTFRAKTGRDEFGPGSDKDFCDLFYTALDLPAPPWKTTGGGLPSDKAALNFIVQESGDPRVKEFVAKMLTWRQYETLITNFLNGFEKNTHDDGLMHPSFPLHNVESYRGSSEGPNFQNLPKRNEEQSEFRKIIIPHLGTIMGEIDASGSELATAAMVTGDTLLTQQVNNKVDLHKYWAARLYEIREQDVKKAQRQLVKSKFVFPEIYGSWYRTIAKDLALDEKHVKRIEQEFWSMYIGVKAWQDDCLKFYDRYGYVKMPMGFRRYAPLSRNQIFNTAIQGTSFHMLLEALWRADCDMIAKGMRSGIEIEVHDSIVPDMVDSEVEDVCQILVHRMVEKQFAWQGTVKRSAEMSIGPTWGDLEEIDISSFLAA